MNMKTMTRAVMVTAFVLIAGFISAQTLGAQQKRVTINSIPAAHNGKAALLYLISGGGQAAWATATVSRGSATCSLLDWVTDQPWNASGNYQVAFLIYNSLQDATSNPNNPLWSGATTSTAITQTNTTVRWSQFIETASSSGTSPSLDGVWSIGPANVTVSGNTGVLTELGSASGVLMDAVNKGYMKVGDQQWRNLRSTGTLTWSGEALEITWNTSNPAVAIGNRWVPCTITMSADGRTINLNGSTWTRR